MDAESEQKLVERVKTLEDQVERLLREGKISDAPEITESKVIETIDRIDHASLTRVLREIPKELWARIFFGMPRKTIEKLKSGVSKNSWKELVEDWTINRYRRGHQLEHEQLLRVIGQLEKMGQIVLVNPETTSAELFEVSSAGTPINIEAYRAQWAERDRQAAQETQRWMDEELEGLL